MPLTTEEITKAINQAEVDAATLTALLTRAGILTQIESKRAEIARAVAERNAVVAKHGQIIADLETALEALIAIANETL